MWALAGALLAAFVILAITGALAGPHLHAGAFVAGIAAAVVLVVVAVAEANPQLAWTLFSLDVAASAAVGLSAWRAIRSMPASGARAGFHGHGARALLGTEAVAVSALAPEGVVRAGGEQWSAICVNGPAPAGSKLQVVGLDGLRLQVWNEDAEVRGLPDHGWPDDATGQEGGQEVPQ